MSHVSCRRTMSAEQMADSESLPPLVPGPGTPMVGPLQGPPMFPMSPKKQRKSWHTILNTPITLN